ncbi:MAG: septal ring lytic transglycosylase RlpA family protein [Verrucomicrobiota bacterium]
MNRVVSVVILCSTVVLCAAGLFSCSHVPKDKDGTWTASWYGEPFHGRKTASGETYNMHGVSAAHKHLPFGTRLHLTNPKNGNSVVVTINDRGPFVRGRDLDLSLGAARKLDMVDDGVIIIDVRVLQPDSSYTREISNERSGYAIQLASFSDRAAAERFRKDLENTYPDARITTVRADGKTLYRVLVGSYPSRDTAAAELPQLKASGHSPLIREFF